MIPKGIYRHFKGSTYEVIGVAIHTETQDGLVLYKNINNPHNINQSYFSNYSGGHNL